MRTSVIRVYSYRVGVLFEKERATVYRVIATSREEAERIGHDLAVMSGMEPKLVHADLDDTRFNDQAGDPQKAIA